MKGVWCVLLSTVLSWAVNGALLTGDVPWVAPDYDNSTTGFQMAMDDVRRVLPLSALSHTKNFLQDWFKVLGYRPIVFSDVPSPTPKGAAGAITSIVFGIASRPGLPRSLLPSDVLAECTHGKEAHCVVAVKDPFFGGTALVAAGSDVRGAIFAAYSLSEHVLSVDPWYHFVLMPPVYVGAMEVDTQLKVVYNNPGWEYRSIFSNDEDLFGGYTPSPVGRSVFALSTFNMFYETVLRLKGNMYLVGTNPFPDSESVELASRRGLIVIHHHYDLLGMDVFSYPKTLPWDWLEDPATMTYAYKASIDAQSKYEVVWSVGYRGRNDYPAPCDPPCTPDNQAERISWVIANQTEWVRSVQPDAELVAYLWAEGVNYLRTGKLIIPKGVTVILTDSGDGRTNGIDLLKPGFGLYTHTAMLNGRANQLTEMVPPGRIFQTLSTFVKKNATKVFILNTSDLLPVPLSTDAWLKAVWNPAPYLSPNYNATQRAFIEQWVARYYGLTGSDVAIAADVWEFYFATPYIVRGNSDSLLSGDLGHLHDIYMDGLVHNDVAKHVPEAEGMIPSSLPHVQSLLLKAQELDDIIPPERKQFYRQHLGVQAALQAHALTAQDSMCRSIIAMGRDHDNDSAIAYLEKGVANLDRLFEAMRLAEGSRWHGLFQFDTLSCFQDRRRQMQDLLRKIAGGVVVNTGLNIGRCIGYNFYDYQSLWPANYPFIHRNDTWNMAMRTQVTMSGGELWYNDGYRVNGTIRFTTDGSQPSVSSKAYSGPVSISATTTVKARAFFGEEAGSVPAATAIFTRV